MTKATTMTTVTVLAAVMIKNDGSRDSNDNDDGDSDDRADDGKTAIDQGDVADEPADAAIAHEDKPYRLHRVPTVSQAEAAVAHEKNSLDRSAKSKNSTTNS